MNEPLRLTSSETWGEEFLVPADAEIVIEGYVLPHVRKEQNPFGEISGHYQEKMNSPVIEVTAVTHRRGAIMQSIFPGHPEHWILGGIPKEGSVINAIRKTVPTVTGVHLPNSGCGRFTCFISLAENHEFIDVNRAAMIAFTEMPNLKMCIIVDEDIDIFNEREVFWAVATQTHWDRDMQVIKKIQGFREWLGDAVVIIDATRPRDIEFPKHNEIPAEALARIDISKYIK
jgi:UbiD family decarboxylase